MQGVAAEIDDEAGGPAKPSGDVGSSDAQATARDLERRLEALAEEIGQVIEHSAVEDRESLHDYAVSLVRDQLPVVEATAPGSGGLAPERGGSKGKAGSNAVTLIGFGFLLVPVGAVLLVVFPPVGLVLLVGGALSVIAGLAIGLVGRLLPSR